MAEYKKSNEEIALELFKEILSTTHTSGTSVRNMWEEIDIRQVAIEARRDWYLDLFKKCLELMDK